MIATAVEVAREFWLLMDGTQIARVISFFHRCQVKSRALPSSGLSRMRLDQAELTSSSQWNEWESAYAS